jgi:hypothetical protein
MASATGALNPASQPHVTGARLSVCCDQQISESPDRAVQVTHPTKPCIYKRYTSPSSRHAAGYRCGSFAVSLSLPPSSLTPAPAQDFPSLSSASASASSQHHLCLILVANTLTASGHFLRLSPLCLALKTSSAAGTLVVVTRVSASALSSSAHPHQPSLAFLTFVVAPCLPLKASSATWTLGVVTRVSAVSPSAGTQTLASAHPFSPARRGRLDGVSTETTERAQSAC